MLIAVWIILLSTTYGMYNQGAYLGPTLMTKLDKDFKVQKIGHNDVQKLKNEGLSTLINNGEIDVHCDRAGPRRARFSLWVGERDIHNLCDRHQMTSYNPQYSPNYGPYHIHQPYHYDPSPLVPQNLYSPLFQPGQYQQGAPQIPAAVGVAAQLDPNQQATTAMFQAQQAAQIDHANQERARDFGAAKNVAPGGMDPLKAHELMMQAAQAAYHANQERGQDVGVAAKLDPKVQEMDPVLAMQQRNQEREAEISRLSAALSECAADKLKLGSDIQKIETMVHNAQEPSELKTKLQEHFAAMHRAMPAKGDGEQEMQEERERAMAQQIAQRNQHSTPMS